jgi:hypothetical protein
MLSKDGTCKSFGEGGDGFVPGEGVGAVLAIAMSHSPRRMFSHASWIAVSEDEHIVSTGMLGPMRSSAPIECFQKTERAKVSVKAGTDLFPVKASGPMSHSPRRMFSHASWIAVSEDEHIVSTGMLGPFRSPIECFQKTERAKVSVKAGTDLFPVKASGPCC